jgi:hypothetical protein
MDLFSMMGGPATHDRERTKVGLSAGDLVPGSTSEYKRQKTAETLLNILEGRKSSVSDMSVMRRLDCVFLTRRVLIDVVRSIPYFAEAVPGRAIEIFQQIPFKPRKGFVGWANCAAEKLNYPGIAVHAVPIQIPKAG